MKVILFLSGIVMSLLIWYKPLKRNINSFRFWMLLNASGGKATEYLRNSPNWKIEATNEGRIKDWFGPYRLNSFGFTYYIYCKTDDVSLYIDDFKKFHVH